VAQQQACLQREGHHLDLTAGNRLERRWIGQSAAKSIGKGIELCVRHSRLPDLAEERLMRAHVRRLPRDRALDIAVTRRRTNWLAMADWLWWKLRRRGRK
jgi:hypothetical protein